MLILSLARGNTSRLAWLLAMVSSKVEHRGWESSEYRGHEPMFTLHSKGGGELDSSGVQSKRWSSAQRGMQQSQTGRS